MAIDLFDEELSFNQIPDLFNMGKFNVVKEIYKKDNKEITFIIFNSETGKISKETINFA